MRSWAVKENEPNDYSEKSMGERANEDEWEEKREARQTRDPVKAEREENKDKENR